MATSTVKTLTKDYSDRRAPRSRSDLKHESEIPNPCLQVNLLRGAGGDGWWIQAPHGKVVLAYSASGIDASITPPPAQFFRRLGEELTGPACARGPFSGREDEPERRLQWQRDSTTNSHPVHFCNTQQPAGDQNSEPSFASFGMFSKWSSWQIFGRIVIILKEFRLIVHVLY